MTKAEKEALKLMLACEEMEDPNSTLRALVRKRMEAWGTYHSAPEALKRDAMIAALNVSEEIHAHLNDAAEKHQACPVKVA